MEEYLKKIVDAKLKFIEKKYRNKKKMSFYKAIKKEGLSIIGEIKKASPSKGLIKKDFNPCDLAKKYNSCVEAISVLTEEEFFLGSDEYLKMVSKEVEIPVLCKDFILDKIQIYNAKALGASAILLIVNILSEKKLKEFYNLAKLIELDVLVEVHTREEIEMALKIGADIIGINNRDLKKFTTNIENTLELRKYIPKNVLVVSESGIKNKEDIKKLASAKVDGILVGESFMRADSLEGLAKDFKDNYSN
ncbi:indole-3-glycerol phosphate synthase TrpC [Fusobacterium sp. MFO224]|uniref:indole-3-glycerol phosphate synthase TrpC n=1 Tax=Fusobacterium sp. MFO224 TaxID=3378070 RepID=UPI003852F9AC